MALGITACKNTTPIDASEATPLAAPPESAAPVPSSPGPATPAPVQIEECTGETELKAGIPGSPGNLIKSSINPNGASELADHMRKMLVDMKTIQAAVRNSTPLPAIDLEDHTRIRCTWPTQESMRKPPYEAFALTYLDAVKSYNENERTAVGFGKVLDACVLCHNSTCEGPVAAINGARP